MALATCLVGCRRTRAVRHVGRGGHRRMRRPGRTDVRRHGDLLEQQAEQRDERDPAAAAKKAKHGRKDNSAAGQVSSARSNRCRDRQEYSPLAAGGHLIHVKKPLRCPVGATDHSLLHRVESAGAAHSDKHDPGPATHVEGCLLRTDGAAVGSRHCLGALLRGSVRECSCCPSPARRPRRSYATCRTGSGKSRPRKQV